MSTENKKRKEKNSYIYNGGDKHDWIMKRFMYFTKRMRNRIKSETKDDKYEDMC